MSEVVNHSELKTSAHTKFDRVHVVKVDVDISPRRVNRVFSFQNVESAILGEPSNCMIFIIRKEGEV
jgi:hypothetical protein